MRYHKLKAGAEPGTYVMETNVVTEDDILTMAKQLSRKRLTKGRCMANPSDVKEHLLTLYRDYEHEVFAVLLLDSTHRLIGLHELFRGTINSAVVHPREVVKLALQHNAAAAILMHNHPSGNPEPSQADLDVTKTLKDTLALISVRVVDHIIVGADRCTSLAQRGQV